MIILLFRTCLLTSELVQRTTRRSTSSMWTFLMSSKCYSPFLKKHLHFKKSLSTVFWRPEAFLETRKIHSNVVETPYTISRESWVHGVCWLLPVFPYRIEELKTRLSADRLVAALEDCSLCKDRQAFLRNLSDVMLQFNWKQHQHFLNTFKQYRWFFSEFSRMRRAFNFCSFLCRTWTSC